MVLKASAKSQLGKSTINSLIKNPPKINSSTQEIPKPKHNTGKIGDSNLGLLFQWQIIKPAANSQVKMTIRLTKAKNTPHTKKSHPSLCHSQPIVDQDKPFYLIISGIIIRAKR